MNSEAAYENSLVLEKLRQVQHTTTPLRIAFLDIDNTWTGVPRIQQQLRDELHHQGFLIACVTNRASELCMSWKARDLSSPAMRDRVVAQEVDPASLPTMTGILDVDIIIGSLGGELLIKQLSDGYEIDEHYAQSIPYSSDAWHSCMQKLLPTLPYAHTTIFLERRIQLFFETRTQRNDFAEALVLLQQYTDIPLLSAVQLIDESNEQETPPIFSIIVGQKHVDKESGVNRVIQVLQDAGASKITTLLAGDGAPDIPMGLYGAQRTDATFIIPGGARVISYLKKTAPPFLEDTYAGIRKKLLPQKRPGWYLYNKYRTVIIGDEAFPGTVGPETLLSWLKDGNLKP